MRRTLRSPARRAELAASAAIVGSRRYWLMGQALVFEIGVEEMPAQAVEAGIFQLETKIIEMVREQRLIIGEAPIEVCGTPRRLVLWIPDLEERLGDRVDEVRGPPVKVAFSQEGEPTEAALGFAKAQSVDIGSLEAKDVEGGQYLFAVKKVRGK